jgi:hypothetical protein
MCSDSTVIPVRATVQEMGPLLLARLLELTEPQEGVLNIAFRWAEDERAAGDPKMAILDLQDLRSMIDEMGKRASELRSRYGNIAPPPSACCSVACWFSSSRVPPISSASRRSTSWISSRLRRTAGASSTFSPPRR